MPEFVRACRSLVRARGFAAAATATFALGIGINTAVFASVDRLLFRPLPYREPDRLFLLQQTDLESGQRGSFLPARYVAEAKAQLDVIEELAILGDSSGYFETPDAECPEIRVSFVTSRMLALSGVTPALGRGFTDEDALERRLAILTHEGWQARFGGEPNVLGRRLWQRGASLEIVGVLPPGYIPPGAFIDPNASGIALMPTPNLTAGAVESTLPPTIRLRPGVSREAAQAAIDGLVARLKPEMPTPTGPPQAVRLIPIRDAMFGQYYRYLWLVAGGAALVLILSCVNLAGLFLAQGRARLRDAAIRLTLGASRRRLVWDAIAQSLIICLAAAAVALLALGWGTSTLEAILPPIFGRFSAGVDWRVVAFALALAILASLVASVLPAWLLGRRDVWRVVQGGAGPLAGGSAGRGRWLIALEAAIGVVLVAAAAVTAKNVTGLTSAALGFDPRDRHLVLVSSTGATPAERSADLQDALAMVRAAPGVISAAGSPNLSILRTGTRPFARNGPPCCRWQVTGDYAATVGMPVLAGRAITDDDVRGRALVAMLNETGLRRVWPGVPPAAAVGRQIVLDGEPAREVVGIAGDTRQAHDADVLPAMFVPLELDPFGGMLLVAHVEPTAPPLYRVLRSRIETPGRRTLIYVRPMAPMYARVLEAPRFRAGLFAIFGMAALVIAMVGLYALTSADVAGRQRELGVRLALGATRPAVLRLVLVDSSKPVALGLAAGLGLAAWAAPILQSFLYRVNPRDPWTWAFAAAALFSAALGAAWVPAWRATRVDPVQVLKQQ